MLMTAESKHTYRLKGDPRLRILFHRRGIINRHRNTWRAGITGQDGSVSAGRRIPGDETLALEALGSLGVHFSITGSNADHMYIKIKL